MIAVLGCGPAGLMAAHALARADKDFTIYSVKEQSPIGGAQYLHKPIIGATPDSTPDASITFLKVGDYRVYSEKVYQQRYGNSSWGNYSNHPMGVSAWSLSKTYDRLWEMYAEKIEHQEIVPNVLDAIAKEHERVISTIPRLHTCKVEHEFRRAEIWLTRGTFCKVHNTILYNGLQGEPWCRTSYLFGEGWTEWPHRSFHEAKRETQIRGVELPFLGIKPLFTDCDCWKDEGVIFQGRFGQHRRGVLVHEAFENVEEMIQHEML